MEDVQLHLGDCLEVLPGLAEASVDLVLADPPYGTTACKWDSVIPLGPMWAGLKHVMKPRGAAVMTASQPFTSALVMSNREWFKYCWAWIKEGGATGFQHAKNAPMKLHEDVAVFSPAVVNHEHLTFRRMTYNPQFSDGTPYKKIQRTPNVRGSGIHRASKCNLAYVGTVVVSSGKRYPVSAIYFRPECGLHPTQKPVALMEYLIRTYTNEGDTVLDFCMGSGTTGTACLQTGRKFIGIERDPAYFAIAQKRIEAARTATPLYETG